MSWLKVSVSAGPADVDAVTEAFERLGAVAVSTQPQGTEPILEPAPGRQPLSPRNRVSALFDGAADVGPIEAGLAELPLAVSAPEMETLGDADWEQAWREEAEPRRFGDGLWVVPADAPCPAGARGVVRLDPGLAFGTGRHPTTALCLEWLSGLDLCGKRVIDFGCGSGILAIAAAVLGAAEVLAWDHDSQARDATRANAAANGVAARVVVTPRPTPAQILVANILADALTALAPRFAELVEPGGDLGLSGILPVQAPRLTSHYASEFVMQPPREFDGWALLTGRKRASAQRPCAAEPLVG